MASDRREQRGPHTSTDNVSRAKKSGRYNLNGHQTIVGKNAFRPLFGDGGRNGPPINSADQSDSI